MALTVKQILFRRGILVAAISSALMGVTLLLVDALRRLLQGLGATDWNGFGLRQLETTLPFVVGVFLCLWLLLPVAAELELRFVVTRAVGAAVLGSVLVFIVQAVRQSLTALQQGQADILPALLLGALVSTGLLLLAWGAFAVLFAIFQWNWLKHHPAKFEVAGMLDV